MFTVKPWNGKSENLRNFYPGFEAIGKHLTVQAKDEFTGSVFGNKRQYTIANVMAPKVYQDYLRAMT